MPNNATDVHHQTQKLVKLKLIEQNLTAMLQKIDKEINQTDVEWMNLKSLVDSKSSVPVQTKIELDQPRPSFMEQRTVKVEHHIDDQGVNNIQLDFSLGNSDLHKPSLEQEEDSD